MNKNFDFDAISAARFILQKTHMLQKFASKLVRSRAMYIYNFFNSGVVRCHSTSYSYSDLIFGIKKPHEVLAGIPVEQHDAYYHAFLAVQIGDTKKLKSILENNEINLEFEYFYRGIALY